MGATAESNNKRGKGTEIEMLKYINAENAWVEGEQHSMKQSKAVTIVSRNRKKGNRCTRIAADVVVRNGYVSYGSCLYSLQFERNTLSC